ncbi:MAG TPA: DEAD/DEAH box helicase [Pantanalinema sp.]
MPTFAELAIAPFLVEALERMRLTEPTEVQATAIPLVMEGKDVLIQSQTGTGKTLAFLLPVLSRLKPEDRTVQAIIAVPTRELGMQIFHELTRLLEGTGLVAQQLIGGANVRHQIERLKKKPHLVVGTPGRLAELINDGKLKTQATRLLVLDEVDHLLDPTFKTDLIRVLKSVSRDRQTLFASATITPEVREVAERWMKDPEHVHVAASYKLPPNLSHAYMEVEGHKTDALRKLIHACQPKAAMVFVNSSKQTEEIVGKLSFKGLKAAALHGGAHKLDRGAILKAFREGQIQVLVTSEMGARGLDFSHLTHVFNLDLPTDAEHYLHRAGRAGRMGREGLVVSLVTPAERFVVEKLGKALDLSIAPVALKFGQLVGADGKQA